MNRALLLHTLTLDTPHLTSLGPLPGTIFLFPSETHCLSSWLSSPTASLSTSEPRLSFPFSQKEGSITHTFKIIQMPTVC